MGTEKGFRVQKRSAVKVVTKQFNHSSIPIFFIKFPIRNLFLFIVICFALFMASMAHAAGTINLPQTGQTVCYDTSGTPMDICTGTGQDGEIQAGAVWPNPRFTDKGDQTVLDNLTGLVWTKDANLMIIRDQSFDADDTAGDGMVTWQHALDYVKKLNTENYLGHNDWRLPNINELESLANASKPNLASWLNAHLDDSVQGSYYWSSTTNVFNTDYAWIVNMNGGLVDYYDKAGGGFGGYVWPVCNGIVGSSVPSALWKTGQTKCYDSAGTEIACATTGQDGEIQAGAVWPSPRFIDNSSAAPTDLTVTDKLTGLVWTKKANLMETRDPLFDADATAEDGMVTWQHALDYVKKLNTENYLGHNDWRLPSWNELRSISDYSQNPALPSGHPFVFPDPESASGNYWSSTTLANDTGLAWVVQIASGGGGYCNKTTENHYVWPVRAGQIGLVISKSGTGSGTVTSNLAGINCGSTCSASYDSGTPVILTATPASGSTFAGWSGSGCSGTGTCTITMDVAKTVTATFIQYYTLTVTKTGSGSGSVTSSPTGISCGSDCTENYTSETPVVTLTAHPSTGSIFSGWSGGECSGTGSCDVTMDAVKNVIAAFSDTTGPTGTISINSDASYTNLLAVTLTLTCTGSGGCAKMQIADVSGNWSVEETYATTKAWNLLSGDGTKTVYVKFKDGVGNWSTPYSDTIVLDTSAPVTVPSTPGGSYTSARNVTLTAAEGSVIHYTTDGSDPTTSATRKQYTGSISVTATTTLKYYAVDPAGNAESVKTDTYTIIPASGSAVNLPKTGQTKCYDTAGTELTSCAGTGQDGELQKGVAWPDPRFTSGTGDEAECMIDNLTGLMWPKNGNLMSGEKTWNEAIDYPKTLTLCGHSDWWLPNINELESLVNASLSTQGFTNVQSGSYWSSTTSASSAGNAWGVNMDDGFVNYSNKISSHYVWPVSWSFGNSVIWQTGQTVLYRAGDDGNLKQGVAWPSPRFTDQNNEEVTDNLTGLVWTKDGNLMKTRDPSFDADVTAQDGAVTWQHALDYVKKLNTENYLGHNDWRLPNRKELHSISDYSQSNPALPVVNPFTNVQQNSYYWSSSTYAIYKGNACVVYMNLGDVVSGGKGNSYYVWPIRTGQIGLVISKSGTGSGTVTSDPAGINCGSTCSASYYPGTPVILTVTPASGSTFAGWSGSGCSGTGTCSVTMDAPKTITAVFNSVGGNVQTFPLSAGWNLISVPYELTDKDVLNVLANIKDNVEIVWGFTPPDTWVKYGPTLPSVLNT